MSTREHLIDQLIALKSTGSYQIFSSFVRNGRVRDWLCMTLNISTRELTAALVDLDNRQADLLPMTIDEIAPKTTKKLRAIFEFVKVQLRKKAVEWIADAILKVEGEVHSASTALVKDHLDWHLSLPIPPASEKLTKISPTRLDSYLRCPFTYYLKRKDVLGDKRLDDRVDELAMWECGNIVHGALEAWGLSSLKDSTNEGEIADFLKAQVDMQLKARFSLSLPAKVDQQGEAAKARLMNFATIQVKHRSEGWKIVEVERKLEMMCGHTRIYGKCDRIDYNELTGEWCVIDYKMWPNASKAICYDEQRGAWLSLQLPLYCAMLSKGASSAYCVLGADKENVLFTSPMKWESLPSAEDKARELIARIERGIYWPPSPHEEWKRDYADWLFPCPEQSVSAEWLADQRSRQISAEAR